MRMPLTRRPHLSTTITTLPRLDPDTALVRQFQATGDARVFERLFRKYERPVFSLVSRMTGGEDAYDLTQDVFVRVLKALPEFRGDSQFRTWLYAIARHACLNHLRERRGRAQWEAPSRDAGTDDEGNSVTLDPPDPLADVPRIAELNELQRAVEATLARLPAEQRMLLTLRDLQGLSYEELTQVCEMSLSNVKSKLHRARLAFREQFAPFASLLPGEPTAADWKMPGKREDP